MGIPDVERARQDVVDLIGDGSKEIVWVENDQTGKLEPILQEDVESLWAITRSVDSPEFSRMVLELKKLEHMSAECYEHMSKERADTMSRQIKANAKNYRLSIDAKSSETRLDKHNTKSNLIDKLLRQRSEKILSIADESKNAIIDAFKGAGKKETMND